MHNQPLVGSKKLRTFASIFRSVLALGCLELWTTHTDNYYQNHNHNWSLMKANIRKLSRQSFSPIFIQDPNLLPLYSLNLFFFLTLFLMSTITSNDNQAFLLRGPNKAQLEPWKMPSNPGPDEVLCRTLSVGICGSDVHYWKNGRCGPFVLGSEPMALGHETAAEVIQCGQNVDHLKPGDRVAAEPTIACGQCEWCHSDQYNLCPNISCHATPPYHGTLQKYFVHSAKSCFKVPDNVTNEECAMIEPLSVAVHACRRVGINESSTVLITGAGAIGLFALQVAKAFGAKRVVITDINENRLKLAKELGADDVILVQPGTIEEEMLEKIKEKFDQNYPDISLECSGVGANFRLVMLATKPGGSCMIIGMGPSELELPIAVAAQREIKILGSFRYMGCFPLAIDLVASGKINLKKMISHRFEFKDVQKAFETAAGGQGFKIMINVAQ